MKVVLTDNIRGLGSTGDIVEVKDGYGRNYLLPKKLAVQPTEGNIKRLKKAREEYLLREKGRIEAARLIAEKIDGTELEITMKANEAGQLFGSVTEAIVAEALGKEIGTELHPQQIILGTHFKRIGEYPAIVRLHSEVECDINLTVVPEETEEEREERLAREAAEAAAAAAEAEGAEDGAPADEVTPTEEEVGETKE